MICLRLLPIRLTLQAFCGTEATSDSQPGIGIGNHDDISAKSFYPVYTKERICLVVSGAAHTRIQLVLCLSVPQCPDYIRNISVSGVMLRHKMNGLQAFNEFCPGLSPQ